MTVGMIGPAWMRELVTAEQYGTWTPERCAGIEILDGMVLVGPSPSKRHNRMARLLANALDAAGGPDWNADTGVDVRLQDVPLNSRPTYRAGPRPTGSVAAVVAAEPAARGPARATISTATAGPTCSRCTPTTP
jgi:hypothetical protein